MSGMMGAPPSPGGNVVPLHPAMAPPAPPPMQPNPAFQQWMQAYQQQQGVVAENAKRQAAYDAAVALIKKDGITGFRLDIEADSTIAPDEQAEKQARIEFMQQFIPLMQQIVPLAQGNPPLAALAKEATLFAVRGFPVARSLEESIETAFDQIAKMPPVPPKGAGGPAAPARDPAVEHAKVQADVHDTELKAKTDMAMIAQKQQEAMLKAQTDAARLQAENEKTQAQMMMQAAQLAQKDRHEEATRQAAAERSLQGLV